MTPEQMASWLDNVGSCSVCYIYDVNHCDGFKCTAKCISEILRWLKSEVKDEE